MARTGASGSAGAGRAALAGYNAIDHTAREAAVRQVIGRLTEPVPGNQLPTSTNAPVTPPKGPGAHFEPRDQNRAFSSGAPYAFTLTLSPRRGERPSRGGGKRSSPGGGTG